MILFLHMDLMKLIQEHLSNRGHPLKIGPNFSSFLNIYRRVNQVSVLGPILFTIFLNDLVFFIKETEVCSFADDITL